MLLRQMYPFVSIVLGLILSIPTTEATADGPAPDDPPNIVFILADDMGYGDPGSFNHSSKIPTPQIDRLADEGMRFTDAHASGSLCIPTRYGLLTGENPARTNWREWNERALIESGQTTIASLLQDAGYTTGMIGKWHLGFEGGTDFDCTRPLEGGPADHGFDYYFGMHASLDIPPYFYIRNDECVTAPTNSIDDNFSPDDFWTDIQGAFWRGGPIAPGLHHEHVLPRFREEAVAFLEDRARNRRERPVFLYLALTGPHTPWLPLDSYEGTSNAGLYGDFTAQVDDLVGEILSTLDRLNMTENTLVIFTSDNGPVWYPKDEEQFDHYSTGVYRGMKADVWEGGHRMPFVARWPGETPAGAVSGETITFTDMLATFAELLDRDLSTGVGQDSHSFLPVLTGQEFESPIRDVTVHPGSGYLAVRQGRWKFIPGLGSGGFSEPQTRDPRAGEPNGQLYDLESDPEESNNLYDEHPDLVERLSNILREYEAAADD